MAVGTCNNTGTFISVNGKAPCQRSSTGRSIDSRHNYQIINTFGSLRRDQTKASCLLAGGHGSGNHSDMDLILQRPRGNNKGNVFHGKAPTLSSNAWEQNNVLHRIIQLNESKESGGIQPYQQNRVYDANGQCPALLAEISGRSHAILSVRPRSSALGYKPFLIGTNGIALIRRYTVCWAMDGLSRLYNIYLVF